MMAVQLSVITSFVLKLSINPISNPKPRRESHIHVTIMRKEAVVAEFKVQSQHLPGGTTANPNRNYRYPSRESNPGTSKRRSTCSMSVPTVNSSTSPPMFAKGKWDSSSETMECKVGRGEGREH
jgi:hypothetical protein